MTRCVLEYLENAAARSPEKTAFDTPEERLSWQEVSLLAQKIGSAVAARVEARSPVLIVMEKSPRCVAAMMGVVMAGCFYTPLDASMPLSRMQTICQVLCPALILHEEALSSTAQALAGDIPLLAAEDAQQTTVNAPLLSQRRAQQIDTDLLYVLFTSGSTGIPKGVSIRHRSVIDFVEWACRALALPEGVRFGSQAPFYFDNSILDIYCAMKQAGSVFLIPRSDFVFPKKLISRLEEAQVDTIFWVPSALTAASGAQNFVPGALGHLKRVFFCGEVMPCSTLNRWRSVLPEADYVNMYGPTEITDVCTWYRVDRDFADTDALPIGRACENTRVSLLDGEICVSGTCLAAGYYNAPEKTAEAFVQDSRCPQIAERMYRTGDLAEYNERGELMFLGRRDDQIKRSGYRIELGEIEAALQAVPGVTLGCCFFDAQAQQITAAYTGDVAEKALKAALRSRLPRYMMPDHFLHRESLPRTGSGKLDRRALRQEVSHEHPVA